jgi:hypothetical protein
MLMESKAWTEAGRAFCLWGSLQSDLLKHSTDPLEGQRIEDLLGLLTPVIKGCLTDNGFKTTVHGQQILGGHGYIRDHGMEQVVRDVRITQIYEGTNGVQAMDLIGRKLPRADGRAFKSLLELITSDIAETTALGDPSRLAADLGRAIEDLEQATVWLQRHGSADPQNVGAAAYPFMELMGIVTLGWMWLKMSMAAKKSLASAKNGQSKSFYEAKLSTARFYAEHELPKSAALRKRIEAGAESLMKIPADAF